MDLSTLNAEQRKAVTTIEGPLLILAGAGSGKTRALTYRIAYLVQEKNISPFNILAITFTNKAAREMKERIEQLIGVHDSQRLWAKTFHSFCLQILRFEVEETCYENGFIIYDDTDQIKILKKILKKWSIDEKECSPRNYLSKISDLKSKMILPEDLDQQETLTDALLEGNFSDSPLIHFNEIYQDYQAFLLSNNALDFDDIICATIRLFEKNPEILEKYQDRFKYILVDEYQDTNYAQYRLLNLLAKKYQNICVVGDDDQSIYEWRGANPENILDFEKDYANTTIIKLETNYRSTQNILDAANQVIENNSARKGKTLRSTRKDGEQIQRYTATTSKDEANFICRKVNELRREKGYQYKDFAVFARSAAQFRALEEGFLNAGLPYKMYGGLKFFQRKEIKDMIAYLALLANPYDQLSFERIIETPKRGIGPKTLEKIYAYMQENEFSFIDVMNVHADVKISAKAKNSLKELAQLYAEAQALMAGGQVTDIAQFFYRESGYLDFLLADTTLESETRQDNVQEFFSITESFDHDHDLGVSALSAFLEEISLYTDIDQMTELDDSITLMTLHSSKGLEFPVVFIAGFEENLFPHFRAIPYEIEAERRLCYVGITRARDYLFLTHAQNRFLYGRSVSNPPSRFFDEIPSENLNHLNTPHFDRVFIPTKPKKEASAKATEDFSLGDKVNHNSWGEGVVVGVDDSDGDLIIKVAFPNQGIKTLLAKYAPIKKC